MKLKMMKDRFKQPGYLFLMLNEHGLLNWLPDRIAIKIIFYYRLGKKLDLDNPKTFNEKLQWIKLYDRRPEYVKYVDKYAVRQYIAETIGDGYLIPLLGVWDKAEDIDFTKLPDQFVLKCTHDSGSVVFCRDKATFNQTRAIESLKKHLKKSGYIHGREWPYKNVPRRIIAEKFMVDESGDDLRDYKVLCFNGEPKLIEFHRKRYTCEQTQDFYDINWNKTTISQSGLSSYQVYSDAVPKPEKLNEMLALSRKLAEGIPHVRVDWYSIFGKLYFGELTFFDGSGFDPFDSFEDDVMLGGWIRLPKIER